MRPNRMEHTVYKIGKCDIFLETRNELHFNSLNFNKWQLMGKCYIDNKISSYYQEYIISSGSNNT